jgi:hypothetical protein
VAEINGIGRNNHSIEKVICRIVVVAIKTILTNKNNNNLTQKVKLYNKPTIEK